MHIITVLDLAKHVAAQLAKELFVLGADAHSTTTPGVNRPNFQAHNSTRNKNKIQNIPLGATPKEHLFQVHITG